MVSLEIRNATNCNKLVFNIFMNVIKAKGTKKTWAKNIVNYCISVLSAAESCVQLILQRLKRSEMFFALNFRFGRVKSMSASCGQKKTSVFLSHVSNNCFCCALQAAAVLAYKEGKSNYANILETSCRSIYHTHIHFHNLVFTPRNNTILYRMKNFVF